MALSDYLSGPEWDACFYASMGQHAGCGNFGASMRKTIDVLLESGYEFEGLDSQGNKFQQVCGGVNAPKVCIWLGNPHNCDVLAILDSGRNFLKKHLPSLVDETDEDWASQLNSAAAQKG